ncbi:hypothetical protein GWI33_004951 [Rhynchophorus ferrugineus]|uniref:Uncharacterized protein n=1 Tax=Rhynchophorus ferrugineus TaxID=354439 RepID=A0A834IWG5_RHYFE|nr:hypothetical protein GWI33_004951 [Rhynchophorus ferrugineus]
MPPQHSLHQRPHTITPQHNLTSTVRPAVVPQEKYQQDPSTQLSALTHSSKSHLLPSPQPGIPPPTSPEPGSITPVGGPPAYPPPALPPGVAPPAPPPGPKTLTSQMSMPNPLKPPPVPTRSSLPYRQGSLALPLGQPPPPPPRNK